MRYQLTRHSLTAAAIMAAAVMMILWPQLAHAATSAGGGLGGTGGALPWEGPLTTISNSIKGPVAYAISLIGTVVPPPEGGSSSLRRGDAKASPAPCWCGAARSTSSPAA